MFGGLSLGMKIAVISILLVAISGAVTYHFVMIADRDRAIAARDTQIADMGKDIEKLKDSNASLEESMRKQAEVNRQLLEQLTAISNRDTAAQKAVTDTQRKLNDPQRQAKLAKVRSSKRAERLLATINSNASCQVIHFAEDGTCTNGIWRSRQP